VEIEIDLSPDLIRQLRLLAERDRVSVPAVITLACNALVRARRRAKPTLTIDDLIASLLDFARERGLVGEQGGVVLDVALGEVTVSLTDAGILGSVSADGATIDAALTQLWRAINAHT
jgi:hypothetical protein